MISAACSRQSPASTAPVPTAAPKVVYVVVTATPRPAPDFRATIAAASVTVPPPAPTAIAAMLPSPTIRERPYLVVEDFLVRQPDSIGNVWYDGEVHNLGSQAVAARVVVKAYSINESLLDSQEQRIRSIRAGEREHFNGFVHPNSDRPIYKVLPEVRGE